MPNWSPSSAISAFLFLLFLTPVSPNCRKGTADECSQAEEMPGFSYAGSSIDIRTLTRAEFSIYDNEKNSGGCTVCENPLLEGKPLQRLPEIVTDWRVNFLCQEEVQHTIYHSPISVAEALTALQVKNDWRKELDVEISPSDKVQWALAGSHSKFIREGGMKNLRDNYTFFLHHMSCSYYKFRVDESHLSSGSFNTELRGLPENYSNNSYQYSELIKHYGTHWVKEFDLGVRIMILTYFSACEAAMEDLRNSDVSHCVSVDVRAYFGFSDTELQVCEEKMKKYNLRTLSHQREYKGGNFYLGGKAWLEEAKSEPGLLSFSLEPLHTLVDKADPRRESLRQALSKYVRKNALWRNCFKSCPPGSQLSTTDLCSCECPSNDFTNSMCCAPRRGVAKLRVTILKAGHLRGDPVSRSDAYVSVSFKNRKMCTHTVWNNNNPTWNATLDFEVIELNEDFNELRVQVWDQDFGWDDDLLGECMLGLEAKPYVPRTCFLDHGYVDFSYHLVCGHKLLGPSCWEYFFYIPVSYHDK